jgi:hypothetical protein
MGLGMAAPGDKAMEKVKGTMVMGPRLANLFIPSDQAGTECF